MIATILMAPLLFILFVGMLWAFIELHKMGWQSWEDGIYPLAIVPIILDSFLLFLIGASLQY